MTSNVIKFSALKVGDAFSFSTGDAPVYVRCRGGYRLGLGGKLYASKLDLKVVKYNFN